MFNDKYSNTLTMFGPMHLITLVVLFGLFVGVVILAKKIGNDEKKDKIFRYSLATTLLVFEIAFHIWTLVIGEYNIEMVPIFVFCAMCNLLTIFFLYTNNKKLASYVIYYTITGMIFSVVFVDIGYGFPHFRIFHYFLVHFGFFLGNVYFFSSRKITINRKNYLMASLYVFSFTMFLLVVNLIFGTEFFYLFTSPVKEISDFFGSPWYTILWIIVIYLLITLWYFVLSALVKYGNKNKLDKK